MFTKRIILVIVLNIFSQISLTMEKSIVKNKQLNRTIFDPYRKNSIYTKITDEHILTIFRKLNSSLSRDNLILSNETSISTNESISIPQFQTQHLPINPDTVAPDGSLVRILLSTVGGSMAQFDLPAGMTSNPVVHRTVYEIWYFLSGEGEFWREQNDHEEIVHVNADVCITIPVGTKFQFRTIGKKSLVAVAITMPPWPGDNEVIHVQGIWNASLSIPIISSAKFISSFHWLSIFSILFITVILIN